MTKLLSYKLSSNWNMQVCYRNKSVFKILTVFSLFSDVDLSNQSISLIIIQDDNCAITIISLAIALVTKSLIISSAISCGDGRYLWIQNQFEQLTLQFVMIAIWMCLHSMCVCVCVFAQYVAEAQFWRIMKLIHEHRKMN